MNEDNQPTPGQAGILDRRRRARGGGDAAVDRARAIGEDPARADAALHAAHSRSSAWLSRMACRLALEQCGGKFGGREVEFFKVDDESEPSKATDNANRLITRDKVDVLIGSVHSGVAMGMLKVAKESGTLMLIPNAGADAATGALCSPNVFRTSFSNWQPVHPLGKVMVEQGSQESGIHHLEIRGRRGIAGFVQGRLHRGRREVVKELFLPFPNVEFQALLTEIAAIKPDAVACFFAGGGAVKFVKDYAAAGLKDKIPLYGSGFLTEGVLAAQGEAAEGLLTTLHYADSLDNPRNKVFPFRVFKSVQGRSRTCIRCRATTPACCSSQALEKVKGDIGNQKAVIAAMEGAVIDSPRGQWKMSKAHNPIQDIYLRRVEKGDNKVIGVAWKALEDPARGCKLG